MTAFCLCFASDMATGLCCLVVLLVLAQCISNGQTNIELGEYCESNNQCIMPRSECVSSQCSCEHPYKRLNDTFCGKFVGDSCTIYTDCIGVSPVECTKGKCTCPMKYKPNSNNTQCNGGTTVILSLVCMLTAVTSITVL